jgi:hypothetical protein
MLLSSNIINKLLKLRKFALFNVNFKYKMSDFGNIPALLVPYLKQRLGTHRLKYMITP